MKKKIGVLVMFCSWSVIAQYKGNCKLLWNKNDLLSSGDFFVNIPNFQPANFLFDDVSKTIFFITKFEISTPIDEASLLINNVVYEYISKNDLKDLESTKIKSALSQTATNIASRDENFCCIKLAPIIKDENGFKKIVSFDYEIQNESSKRANQLFNTNVITNSILANGEWFQFFVAKSGVYKISKKFLQQLGFNTDSDPRNFKIYGNGGQMLPLQNNVAYPIDLVQNAIQVSGENDGVFNDNDFILFYADGVDNWDAENQTHNNLYENRSFYYITAQGGTGKRISPLSNVSGSGTVFTNFDATTFYEKDLVNVARLGRKWFGEGFNINAEQEFNLSLANFDAIAPASITVAGVGASFTSTNFEIIANGTVLGNLNFSGLVVNSGVLGSENSATYNFPATENIKIGLKYNNNSVPSSRGFLDYISIKYKQKLTGFGKQFRFQVDQAATIAGVGEFQISNATNISQVWDITDKYNVQNTANNNQNIFIVKATLGEVRKYVAIDNADFYLPTKESQSRIANQNLKGTIFKNAQNQFQDVDYLIITPNILNGQAEKLANFHRNNSQMNVKVVNLDLIYHEFSSGKQDIAAIRNFVKYVYENASSPSKKIKYLCLFGDTSFDPRNILKTNSCLVPIYYDIQSFSLQSSFISDDFYGLMDINEGNMQSNSVSGLDIAVGRMLVNNAVQADEMVNKVIEYHDIKSFGRWRNNFVLISDDVDKQGEFTLQQGLDNLGDQIFAGKPFVNLKKIHSDSYLQETAAGGKRYPKARQDLIDSFEQGALVFSYFGHGGEDGLAAERLWDNSDGLTLSNQYKYPLFVTITCEFTRFDNPFKKSGGEILFDNPRGGAISLVTTTRQIFISTGLDINNALSANLYGLNSNSLGSMAEALRKAKNSYNSPALMVFYIGDPAINLSLPKPKILLTKVNDIPVSQPTDAFKALATMKISGEVRDEQSNNLLSNYNGDLAVNIFDKPITRKTLGNDGVTDFNGQLQIMNFVTLGETIFRGNASINNGLFEFSFVVPRDIRVPLGIGRISFYSKKSNLLENQAGFDTDIKIGGVNTNAPADNTPPSARLYMNDESFVSGGITNESPFLLAFLEDENGINTASGIGHDIIGILDGNETKPIILNDYYETEPNNFKKGKLRFPFRNLSVGLHTLKLRAWDVYNNPIVVEIQFLVVSDQEITLTNVLNYPNPFVDYTQFWFTHNKPFEPLQVQVQVFTISGKIVCTKNQTITTEGFLSREITWDGRDDFGDKLGKGVYVYKLTVQSLLSNQRIEKYEKLVIL
ncbi:MAG: hypothetical protein RLZZ312_859 [Bacteroidota bacterium]